LPVGQLATFHPSYWGVYVTCSRGDICGEDRDVEQYNRFGAAVRYDSVGAAVRYDSVGAAVRYDSVGAAVRYDSVTEEQFTPVTPSRRSSSQV
jgi:hypothetical protein